MSSYFHNLQPSTEIRRHTSNWYHPCGFPGMTGKDRSDKYHPQKGKPSGSRKKANEHLTPDEIRNESSVNNDALEHTQIRHVNRDLRKLPKKKSGELDNDQ